MAWRRGPTVWSPVEEDYLKENRDKPINQLTVALAKGRTSIKRKLDEFDGKEIQGPLTKRTKIGKRDDILVNGKPLFLRSGWEANFARYLTYKGFQWEYEPTVFFFHGVRRGTNSYCPDFKTPKIYFEIKGQLDSKGRAAIRRFKKYYPEEFKKLKAVVGRPGTKADSFFRQMGVPIYAYISDLDKKYQGKIPNWE